VWVGEAVGYRLEGGEEGGEGEEEQEEEEEKRGGTGVLAGC
jgi:hypothetical protein